MEVFKEISPLQNYLKEHKRQGKTIGLVPTMGALHAGHLSLISKSQEDNDITVCSIFVNPVQFNNENDLALYPRTLKADLDMLLDKGCQVVFCPHVEEVYASLPIINFDFGYMGEVLEGKYRPGHFSGVAIVVSKLFNIVLPDRAYFGQKDLQQYTIIKQMVEDMSFNIQLIRAPIMREPGGLAMSSRNVRLTLSGREKASHLYARLQEAKQKLRAGEKVVAVEQCMRNELEEEGIKVDYLCVVDPDTLRPVEGVGKQEVAVCVAAFVEDVRLIDNIIFNLESKD